MCVHMRAVVYTECIFFSSLPCFMRQGLSLSLLFAIFGRLASELLEFVQLLSPSVGVTVCCTVTGFYVDAADSEFFCFPGKYSYPLNYHRTPQLAQTSHLNVLLKFILKISLLNIEHLLYYLLIASSLIFSFNFLKIIYVGKL